MQILPNGQVQIQNSQTGEIKVVDPMQLGSISPFLANQYFAYMTQQKALDKASAGSGTTDTLVPPADTSVIQGGNGNTSNTPDLSGLSNFRSAVKPKPVQPKIIISGLSGNNPMGTGNTPMTMPVQYQPPQPQKPMASSTFDISKVNF